MADINFEDFGKTITNAAEVVGKKTEAFIAIQKIKGQIHSSERSIERNYKDLGEIIFNRYAAGEEVDDEVAIICEEISQVQVTITEHREKLAERRGCRLCPVCETEVPQEALFCMQCGAMMPEDAPAEAAEEKEADVTEEQEEAAEDLEETVESDE